MNAIPRARARTGDTERAVAQYGRLKAIWHRAEPELAELAEADRYLAQHVSERR